MSSPVISFYRVRDPLPGAGFLLLYQTRASVLHHSDNHAVEKTLLRGIVPSSGLYIYVIACILVESLAAFLEKQPMMKGPSGPLLVKATREAGRWCRHCQTVVDRTGQGWSKCDKRRKQASHLPIRFRKRPREFRVWTKSRGEGCH